jgi:hypothetical protein
LSVYICAARRKRIGAQPQQLDPDAYTLFVAD